MCADGAWQWKMGGCHLVLRWHVMMTTKQKIDKKTDKVMRWTWAATSVGPTYSSDMFVLYGDSFSQGVLVKVLKCHVWSHAILKNVALDYVLWMTSSCYLVKLTALAIFVLDNTDYVVTILNHIDLISCRESFTGALWLRTNFANTQTELTPVVSKF